MNSIKQQGHLAGLLWLLSASTGGWAMSYIRSNILVPGDAAATAAHLVASESLFRTAIVSGLLSQLLLFFFGLALFRLFKDVGRSTAIALLTSIVITVAIAVVNTLNLFAALAVLGPADYLKAFAPDQLNAAAMIFFRLNNTFGQALIELFWAPYFFAFGLLVIKSRFLPRILGFLLLVMSAGYAINVLTKFLAPHFYPATFTTLAMALGALGGVPTMFWLLIRGAKEQPPDEQSAVLSS
jgi:hypothetical protein